MQQFISSEDPYRSIHAQSLAHDTVKAWREMELRAIRTSEYQESKEEIVNSIKNMSSEIASLKEGLANNNKLLKATNDLLLQITSFLSIYEAQSYFWTEEWQKAEKEATRDIETGKVHKFEDSEQLIEFLHS